VLAQTISMKKESKYTEYLEWILMLVLFLGLIIISKQFEFLKNLKPDTSTGKYIMIAGIVLMGFVVLAVHELGHLIAGLMNGFRFELFVVGPLGVKRENDKVKIYLNKNLGYYGGVAATTPVDDHDDNGRKFAKVLLAGPIASIIFAMVCFVLAYLAGKPLGFIFYTGGLISIAIFFATTIPSRTGMFFTDRKRYQRLVHPGKDQDVELAMLKIMGTFSKDNSYKNMNKKDIQVLIDDDLPFIKFFGLFNLFCFQLEHQGRVDEDIISAYENLSKKMSKNLVVAFNKEIEQFKEGMHSAERHH
jgi:hypothetical protein